MVSARKNRKSLLIGIVAKYDGFTIYGDSTHGTGLIFYPGGKVETDAYASLLYGLAQRGICCVAVYMLLHLAVLKPNVADDIIRQITSIDNWFIGGHSLGGVILLAAYPTDPLGESYPVLSVYGSNDDVLGITDEKQLSAIRNASRFIGDTMSRTNYNSVSNDYRKTYHQDQSVTVNVDGLSVRDAQDIRALALEIDAIKRRAMRGKGV